MNKNKETYIKPLTAVFKYSERLMLDLPVKESFVDDEAAKRSLWDDDDSDWQPGTTKKSLWDDDDDED
ncbi:MAG: hypothetical protein IJ604_04115 [Prevotella sp.]|nr:hypothetical protein [Prevotella sp.]